MTRRRRTNANEIVPAPGEPQTAAIRGLVERQDSTGLGTGSHFSHWKGWPRDVLIFDTETTIDATQRLLYGFFRIARWNRGGRLRTLYEGILHANDLPTTDPEGFAKLQAFAERERADVEEGQQEKLHLLSRDDFMQTVFWPVARRMHGIIAGFNLPFDLTRIALGAGPARRTKGGNNRFRGGFSLCMSEWTDKVTGERREDRYDPRLWIKHIEQQRAFMQLGTPAQFADREAVIERDANGKIIWKSVPPGHFLDVSTLAFALTSDKYSLKSAAETFKTAHQKGETEDLGRITEDSIAYARLDVLVTLEVLEKLRSEFDKHPIQLDPCKAYSPAGIGKAYLSTMGLAAPHRAFTTIPNEVHGIATNAYYGGRAEARIRRTAVPVVHTDFLSMYPTCNALLGLWDLITAQEIRVEDASDDVRELLTRVTHNDCFDQALWPQLNFFAAVIPEADILPVRARYDANVQSLGIGVNYATSKLPLWFAGPDLVASTILTGKTPNVVRAVRLVPVEKQRTLRPITFGGTLTIDPAREDFFKRVIELRRQAQERLGDDEGKRVAQFLKILANSTGYGVFAEMNREELAKDEKIDVAVYGRNGPFMTTTGAPENPGQYAFQPFASLTTAAARLVLALLERSVTARGGAYAFCDTDSMAIVATKDGGPVEGLKGRRALSWSEVDQIVQQFQRLNPYDTNVVPGSVLQIEKVNNDENGDRREMFAYVISAKRYAFFTRPAPDAITILEASEHGLGHLIDPLKKRRKDKKHTRQWIADVWDSVVCEALGLPASYPSYLLLPAASRIAVTTTRFLEPFAAMNEGHTFDDQIKPSNFLLSVTVDRFGHPAIVHPARYKHFHLVRPSSKTLDGLTTVPWIDIHTGEEFHITTDWPGDPNRVRVKTYGDVLRDYRTHIEGKSAGPDSQVCAPLTAGLLRRRHIVIDSVVYIGKEANRLSEVTHGTVHDLRDVLNVYLDPADDPWVANILPRLRAVPVSWLRGQVEISERRLRMLRAGNGRPNIRTRAGIVAALESWEQGHR